MWTGMFLYLIIALSFVTIKDNKIPYSSIDVEIKDTTHNYFVSKEDVLGLLNKKAGKIIGNAQSNVNLANIERIVESQSAIKRADVYRTHYRDNKKMSNKLMIDLYQRRPILRVINFYNNSYYLDENELIMPLSPNYTARVLTANGYITEQPKRRSMSWTCQPYNVLRDLFVLSKFIQGNKFWNAQIQQIYVNENREFELVPTVGQHIIILGTIENYQLKFEKLKIIYQNVLNPLGWNLYKTIDLKYKNQVVCTK